MRHLTHRTDGEDRDNRAASVSGDTAPGGRMHVTLDPAAVLKEMRAEELYSGYGFHPPLRTLP